MDKESRIDDVPAVLMASLDFEIDPEHNFWFRAPWQSGYVYLRMNRHFPDGAYYSLWFGDGKFGDLEKTSSELAYNCRVPMARKCFGRRWCDRALGSLGYIGSSSMSAQFRRAREILAKAAFLTHAAHRNPPATRALSLCAKRADRRSLASCFVATDFCGGCCPDDDGTAQLHRSTAPYGFGRADRRCCASAPRQRAAPSPTRARSTRFCPDRRRVRHPCAGLRRSESQHRNGGIARTLDIVRVVAGTPSPIDACH